MKARLVEFLHTGIGQPPSEWLTLILCRDIYHCRPSELADEPLAPVLQHVTLLSAEAAVRSLRPQQHPGRPRRTMPRRL